MVGVEKREENLGQKLSRNEAVLRGGYQVQSGGTGDLEGGEVGD